MTRTSIGLDARLGQHLSALVGQRESPALAGIRTATAGLPEARMQIGIEQGRLLALLARLIGTRQAIEVGVFTGYSALCVAEVLPEDGRLVACDVSREWTDIGRPFWDEARVTDRIDLRLAPAADTLRELLESGESGRYDQAFIDADKEGYPTYYEQCLALLRPGGVVILDNAFLGGRVVDPSPDDPEARVMHDLSRRIFSDDRVDPTLIPIGDGILVARKR